MDHSLDLPDDIAERAIGLLELAPFALWHNDALSLLKESLSSQGLIGIACSGGADSTFSLILSFAAFPQLRKRMVVLHYNHQLRKDDSEGDESFVCLLARKLGLPCKVGYPENPKCRPDEGVLRKDRLGFYAKQVKQNGSMHIIQGHNLDDIAETLLWRIPRGVSVDGLISPQAVSQVGCLSFLRPFVTLSRQFIRVALKNCSIPWREDASNQENEYLRNRMRNLVLPKWTEASDRDLLQGVAQTVDLLSQDSKALEHFAKESYNVCKAGEKLDFESLTKLPCAIQRRVLIKWFEEIQYKLAPPKSLSAKTGRLVQLLKNTNFTAVQLAEKLSVRKRGGFIEFECLRKLPFIPKAVLPFSYFIYLPCGGRVLAEQIILNTRILDLVDGKHVNPQNEAFISLKPLPNYLFIRSRKEGDMFRPLGSPGSKKLSDWMIDRKWSKAKKTNTPIFLNQKEEVIWIPGFAPAESAKVSKADLRVIRLTYQQSDT
jgi:tRNA(Ile)-lysidine synthase